MMTARTIVLFFVLGLAPAFADEASCTYCYQDGMDARQRGELESALRFFERGCERDDGASCAAVSGMLSRGEGAPEDDTRAISFGLRGCDLGYWQGCNDIGLALVRANDPGTAAKGRELLGRACEGGKASGCGYLGAALRDGLGGPADAAAGNRYLERACDGGSVAFCSDLAAALAKGTGGLEVDIPRAAALFQKACDGGWQKGCENAELLARATQKEPAREQAKGWSFSGENVSFSTRSDSDEEGDAPAKTSIGSMQVGQGNETATFSDVRSSCGMLQLTVAFSAAAAPIRQCLGATDTRRVTLVVEDGLVTSSSVEPDDAAGRCVVSAMGRAHVKGLTCGLEADVSR